MKKYLSFEHTFAQQEIEQLLIQHLYKKLNKEDKDFRNATLVQHDFTYSFQDGKPSIDVFVMCDHVKMIKP